MTIEFALIGAAILAALVCLWRLRPSTRQGLWIGGGVVLAIFIYLEAIMALGYHWNGVGGGTGFVFILGGAFVGWMVSKLFRIK